RPGHQEALFFRNAAIILQCSKNNRANVAASLFPQGQAANPRETVPSDRGATMTPTQSPQVAAAEAARETFRKAAKEFETFKLDTTVPESVRALAEKTVNQSREAYERGKDALEEAIDALERSFDAAGQGATAFNRKLIDLSQRNLNSAFDLAKSLAGAKNLG